MHVETDSHTVFHRIADRLEMGVYERKGKRVGRREYADTATTTKSVAKYSQQRTYEVK